MTVIKPILAICHLALCIGTFSLFAIAAPQPAQQSQSSAFEESALAVNTSQFGVKYPETFVLLQNRMGLRIEYNVERGRLQIWISPQAGKSMSYRERNFSNRDDHSDVFERILMPNLRAADFLKCDYDPFHSVLYFKSQKLHIAHVYDQPVVLIWFEKDGVVDFKSAKDDRVVARTPRQFHITHADRGQTLDHVALIGSGEGTFRHQLVLDDGRSTYARAELKGGQVLAIAAELEQEKIADVAARILANNIDTTLSANETKIAAALDTGRFMLKGRPEMQKLLDVSRRVALSMQDERGFMRSTNQYIYYLLWYRDGGMNTAHLALSGWPRPARWQTDFALQNPNVSNVDPTGTFYGQVMGGPITKWEEDGLFYVVWSAFVYWTQTGDQTFTRGAYLKTMEDAMDWLERYSFDAQQGLFCRFYYTETPLSGSRDDGYDNATGAPSDHFSSEYHGKLIKKSYDIYINSLNLAAYYMLAAMETGERASFYLAKAQALEKHMRRFYETDDRLPSYGDLLADDGSIVKAAPYGMDQTDYQWSLALPPFRPFLPKNFRRFAQSLEEDLRKNPTGMFICGYNSVLTSLDTELHNEDQIMAALDYLVPQSVRPGKYLPMANTVPEIVDIRDGDMYHDVRPIVFSSAPFVSAVTNLGLRRLPFGIAVRGTKYLESIDHYEYKSGLVDITFRGKGAVSRVLVNGQPLEGSLQIPENRIAEGEDAVVVEMSPEAKVANRLVASTVRLDAIEGSRFHVYGFGQNVLTFKGLTKHIGVVSADGKPVNAQIETDGDVTWIDFPGRGSFVVRLR